MGLHLYTVDALVLSALITRAYRKRATIRLIFVEQFQHCLRTPYSINVLSNLSCLLYIRHTWSVKNALKYQDEIVLIAVHRLKKYKHQIKWHALNSRNAKRINYFSIMTISYKGNQHYSKTKPISRLKQK